MCKVCGCVPCKCGRDMIDGTCEGCGMTYDDCDCEKLEQMEDMVPKKVKQKQMSGSKTKKREK